MNFLTVFGLATMLLFGYATWLFWFDDREPVLAAIYATAFVIAAAGVVASLTVL